MLLTIKVVNRTVEEGAILAVISKIRISFTLRYCTRNVFLSAIKNEGLKSDWDHRNIMPSKVYNSGMKKKQN